MIPESSNSRLQSIDLLRGAVMVLMAIDHVRVYSGLPAGGPEPGIFFTRWITHYCAPAFVFFAGTAAFMYGRKTVPAALARFLVTRGLILVVLELTLIRFGWSFNLNYSEFILAGVIWMIGWCMVLMALFVNIRPVVVGVSGLLIILLQQLFAWVPKALPIIGSFWEFIYPSGNDSMGGIAILYVIVPWVGVMMAGYGFGEILMLDPKRSEKICLRIGFTAIALFFLWSTTVILWNPIEGDSPLLFQLLNQRKYPASARFLLMTLGPVVLLVPFAEKARGRLTRMVVDIGRVPFFYYLLHIPLIHVSALLLNKIRTGSWHGEWYDFAPFSRVPEEFRWNLSLLYGMFFIDVMILYFSCRWYAAYKLSHPDKKWLKFL